MYFENVFSKEKNTFFIVVKKRIKNFLDWNDCVNHLNIGVHEVILDHLFNLYNL